MSEMFLVRRVLTDITTIGDLYFKSLLLSNILEPPMKPNADGLSCIPHGFYKVTPYQSPRFGKIVPLLNNVPGHEYIEMHTGNSIRDTHDCLVVGLYRPATANFVFDSQDTFNNIVMTTFTAAWATGDLYLSIINS